MSISSKKAILAKYFEKNGGMPEGTVDIDADADTVGNVFLNDSYFGTFDYTKAEFISLD